MLRKCRIMHAKLKHKYKQLTESMINILVLIFNLVFPQIIFIYWSTDVTLFIKMVVKSIEFF